MPHIISYTEEIGDGRGLAQHTAVQPGQRYLKEAEGKRRLHIVRSVKWEKAVWKGVDLWRTEILEYNEEEYVMGTITVTRQDGVRSTVPAFLTEEKLGVLSCHADMVEGVLVIPNKLNGSVVRGIMEYGFFGCSNLTKVVFRPDVVIVYPRAFANSGLREMEFNDETPVLVHITALDDCKDMPKFNRLFDKPFPGKYMMFGGERFDEWEDKLRQLNFLHY